MMRRHCCCLLFLLLLLLLLFRYCCCCFSLFFFPLLVPKRPNEQKRYRNRSTTISKNMQEQHEICNLRSPVLPHTPDRLYAETILAPSMFYVSAHSLRALYVCNKFSGSSGQLDYETLGMNLHRNKIC